MESWFNDLQEIGVLIDELDVEAISSKFEVKSIDVIKMQKIEVKMDSFNLDSMNLDEQIIYHYTCSNYQAIVNLLAINDFDAIRKLSKFVAGYSSLDDFVFDNYNSRISEYRKAIKLIEAGTELSSMYLSQIFVNLANLYLEMGRVVESIQELMNANSIVKGFPMARANLAMKHYSLATRTNDESVMKYLMEKGLDEIRDVADKATPQFIPLDILENFYDWEQCFERSIESNLSEVKTWSEEEDVDDAYKVWASKQNLSLNYINVIYKVGNVDNIHMPDMGIGYFSKSNNLEYYAWFNTIKQEFNMARYYLYQLDDIEDELDTHESQLHNVLVNTLDYPAMGYRTELLKNSLRTAFGVLDKIGLFCCHFHGQKMQMHKINFESWYKEISMDVAIKSPFNALYWLSQDLNFKLGEKRDIRLLRNVLEHRYIRVVEHSTIPISEELADRNKYEYRISFSDLKVKAYDTLRFVRCAVFYMVSGFNIEFNRFYHDPNREQIFIPLMVSEYDDEWKN